MSISLRLKTPLRLEAENSRISFERDTVIRMASSTSDYIDAFRIAYNVYFPLGFAAYAPNGLRMSPYQFLPGTMLFVAHHKGEAVACLSLYENSEEGLPGDHAWRDDLDRLRATGKKLFEVGSLMVLPNCPLRGPGICLALFRQAWIYARTIRKADTLCAFVQERHALFYQKMLNFTFFGPVRNYSWNGLTVPKVSAMVMNLDGAEAEYKRRFDHFGDSPKNLYRRFVIDQRGETEAQLRQGLHKRARLNLEALHRQLQSGTSNALPRQHAKRRQGN